MGIKIGGQIEKVNAKDLSYSDFVEKYLIKNQPVVLKGLMDDWRACKDWVIDNGRPNLHFFATHFGKSKVQVADCDVREYTDQKRVEMSVSEFISLWLVRSEENSDQTTLGRNQESVLYLKDWHFVKEYPEYEAYRTPLLFSDDWLNFYLDYFPMHKDPDTYKEQNDISCSDYRFVYMGARGSWTPLHADVFRSYSWSANVCGKKKWLFLPPSQSHLVFDRYMNSCVYSVFEDVSDTKYPGFKKTIWLECMQEQDEIIFVPSGWYHQVQNLEDTISINHNWFNAHNLSWVCDLLLQDYKKTKESIEDIRDICDDFETICQRNLAANTGMNFHDFFSFISLFTLANVNHLHNLVKDYETTCEPMARHLALNLLVVQKIMLNLTSVDAFAGNNSYVDFEEALDDPRFLEMYRALSTTYTRIHEQQSSSFDVKKDLMTVTLKDYNLRNCTPVNLVKIIEVSIVELKNMKNLQNFLFENGGTF